MPENSQPPADTVPASRPSVNLTHHFLIAMPSLIDEHFNGSLVYVAEHSARGALGVVINRAMNLTMGEVFKKIGLGLTDLRLSAQPVMQGGPVQTDRGFVLHAPRGSWTSTLSTNQDICLTSSKDILEACAQGKAPDQILLALGCSSWSAGQLEDELGRNAWLTVPATPDIVFEVPPEERFNRAFASLGISQSSFLSSQTGHA